MLNFLAQHLRLNLLRGDRPLFGSMCLRIHHASPHGSDGKISWATQEIGSVVELIFCQLAPRTIASKNSFTPFLHPKI